MDTVSQFLLTLKSQTPDELKPTISQFEDFYDKKLWHQLTGILISFANQKSAAPLLLLVYSGFVKHWQSSMNKLSLVQFAAIAAVQCVGISH